MTDKLEPAHLLVPRDIRGRIVHLDGEDSPRSVWLGQAEGGFAIAFTDRTGEVTRLALTADALDALTSLYTTEKATPAAADDTYLYVTLPQEDGKLKWVAVEDSADE